MNWLERAINKGQSQILERQKAAREAELAETERQRQLKAKADDRKRAILEELDPDIEKVAAVLHQFEKTPGWKVDGPKRSKVDLRDSESIEASRPKYITEVSIRHEYPEPSGRDDISYTTMRSVETVAWYVSKAPFGSEGNFENVLGVHIFTSEENETFYICHGRGIDVDRFTSEGLISSLEKQIEEIVSQGQK